MKLRAIRADDKVQISMITDSCTAAHLCEAGCVSSADCRGRSGESEREGDSGSLSGQRDESAGSYRGATERAAQPGNHGNQTQLSKCNPFTWGNVILCIFGMITLVVFVMFAW